MCPDRAGESRYYVTFVIFRPLPVDAQVLYGSEPQVVQRSGLDSQIFFVVFFSVQTSLQKTCVIGIVRVRWKKETHEPHLEHISIRRVIFNS